MPFGVLARLLTRLLMLGALGALRRRTTPGAPPPWRTPGTGPASAPPSSPGAAADQVRAAVRARLAGPTEVALVMLRLFEVVVLGAAVTVLVTAGTTSAVLTPRWVGGVLLGLALVIAVFTIREVRIARRMVTARRRRRAQDRLRQIPS
ncbi:MAG: hypothetical protein E6J14_01245 [Chloroflexi bacterium]|nr:MAG: hypothetical protein E6J14_01245 [Chloroflexota bacterium]